MVKRPVLLAMTMLAAVQVYAGDEVEAKTVIGPSNLYLYDGANALLAGDPVEGVPLTLKGLAPGKLGFSSRNGPVDPLPVR